MLQELCRDSFFSACKAISGPEVKLKGRTSPFMDFCGAFDSFVRYDWKRLPLSKVKGARENDIRNTRNKAWCYFNDVSDKLRENYLRVRWGHDLRRAMNECGTFSALFDDFYNYFEERKANFMETTEKALDATVTALAAKGKHPQSHGGVANLLKVLTKTMHDQGSSVYTIAKVQYAVCMQAGIYIPDDFLTDVLVAHEMVQEG